MSNFVSGFLEPSEYEEWDKFVTGSPQGCIFCRSWWLEAVCPNGFKILTLRKGGRIVAGMPLPTSGKGKYNNISMPKLTQVLGVILSPSRKSRYHDRLSEEMKMLKYLVKNIPDFKQFAMHFHYNFTNWLPLYWEGFRQTTRYTYVIPDLTDLDKVLSEFSYSKKKNINKAEKLVSVHEDFPASEFYREHVMTLAKEGKKIIYSFDLFKKIYDTAYKKGCGKTLYALDSEKNVHAAIFVVFDSKSAYYLISAIDPDFRNSGASTLLLRDAIEYVSKYTNRFDFEGSMIPGVENSFRNFGAVQTPYFHISKDRRSKLQKCFPYLRFQATKLARKITKRR